MKEKIELYKSESNDAFLSIPTEKIETLVNIIVSAYKNENKIFACGNGGNVASVQNLVLDLNMHPFVSEDKSKHSGHRNKFQAISLCDSGATITGITNDLGFEFIFSEQLKYQASEGDIIFAFSGSGNSKNVIEALKYAKSIGMICVVMTRNKNTKSDEIADLVLRVDSRPSTFPGQTGGNNNNFHYEDCISKISHIAVGLLKEIVSNEN
ncbi:MAG: D-sedoheptulose-7-phosphate isomerase [Candidatus Hodarchaeales archaeon]|jgi:D-sedoheptulose 7-phosphate isomerase